MSLSARAIALQGVGFGPLQMAMQGFADVEVVVQRIERSAGYGSAGPGGQISRSEFLRRYGPPLSKPPEREKRRRKDEEELELLAAARELVH